MKKIPPEIESRVKQIAPVFLRGLARAELEAVLKEATLRRFSPRTLLCMQGHPANAVYMILDGRVCFFTTTPNHTKVIVFWSHPGEMVGLRTMLTQDSHYMLSAETDCHDCTALMWTHMKMMALAKRYTLLLDNSLSLAANYLDMYCNLHIALVGSSARSRLSILLERLVARIGKETPDGMEVVVRNKDLASESSMTVFTVSRLMSEWEKKGLVVKGRGRILIPSLKKLREGARP
jgi:CRP-like cAMP-binding protein